MTSSRPYLIQAIYEWIVDNQLTPYIMVDATAPNVQVPAKYVIDNKIILNISMNATRNLIMNKEVIEFDARFNEAIWHMHIPVHAVQAVYAQENGRGMVFDEEEELIDEDGITGDTTENKPIKPKRPELKIVK